MTEVSSQQLQTAIATYTDPYINQDLVTAKLVKDIRLDGDVACIEIELGFPALGYHERLRAELSQRLLGVPGIQRAEIGISFQATTHAVQKNLKPVDSVKNVIAVASGKGGVGKSTRRLTLPWHSKPRVPPWACSMPTSMDPVSHACWAFLDSTRHLQTKRLFSR